MRQLALTLLLSFSLLLSQLSIAAAIKIATLSPDGSSWMKTMRAAAKEINEKTEQRVKFRFYPGGVMGNDKSVLKKIRIGQLHGAMISGGALAKFAPNTQIYNLPLLFNNLEQVDYVRSKMDADIEKEFSDAGFVNFGLAEGGFAYVMSKHAIATPADLKKNKVWIPSDDPASESAATTFGISPIPLHLGDVLAGLQTGLVNTVTTSSIAAIALQWHTQVNYITELPLTYFYGLLAIDKKAFNKKISAQDQVIVNDVMRTAFTSINKQNRIDNASAYKAILEQGIKPIILTSEQKTLWQQKINESIANYLKQGRISPDIYQRIIQLLKESQR